MGREKCKNAVEKLDGVKLIVLGIVISICSTGIINIVGAFKTSGIAFWINMILNFVSWAFIITGLYKVKKIRKEYRLSFMIAILGSVCICLSSIFFLKEYRAFGVGGFVSLNGMFLKYISDVAMLSIIYFVILALFNLMAKQRVEMDYEKRLKKIRMILVGVLILTMLVPFGYIFSKPAKYILTIIFAGGGVSLKGLLVRTIDESDSHIGN